MQQAITPELSAWIVAQAEAGHSPAAVLQAMKASGWHEDTALQALEQTLQAHVQRTGGAHQGAAGLGPQTAQANASAGPIASMALPVVGVGPANTVWAHDREVRVLMRVQHPCVVVLAELLSPGECQALIDMARERLGRSETVAPASGGSEVNAARTSEGMFFGRAECALIERIEARLAALTQWPEAHGEGLQVLRYTQGAKYKPHYDYFDPEHPGSAAVLRRGGQRVATIVMYLNTPEQGGATVFPDIGLSVHPVAGQAVFFSYSSPSPQTRTLHGGAPVEQGEKWVATKWLRQGRFE